MVTKHAEPALCALPIGGALALAQATHADPVFGGAWVAQPYPAPIGPDGRLWGRAAAASQYPARALQRRNTCDGLRRAGFYARRAWARDGERWTSGPCAGLAVSDPWDVLRRVRACCRYAVEAPTTGGRDGSVVVGMARCRRGKLCAVCAAADGAERAARIEVIATREGAGRLVQVTLTHRDGAIDRESCAAAWLRFDGAWQRLRTGRSGAWWAASVFGAAWTLETTGGATGRSWHPHQHGVVELQDGVDFDVFRNELATRWAALTRSESDRAGAPGGWDRVSGADREGRERWCELLDPTDAAQLRRAVYQLGKYATPLAELRDADRLAEWVQWSPGRKMCRWNGAYATPGLLGWVDAIVAERRELALELAALEGRAPDVGRRIRGCRPLPIAPDRPATSIARWGNTWRSAEAAIEVGAWYALSDAAVGVGQMLRAQSAHDTVGPEVVAAWDRVVAGAAQLRRCSAAAPADRLREWWGYLLAGSACPIVHELQRVRSTWPRPIRELIG